MILRKLHTLLSAVRARLAMPLLIKELSETAARRRTYVLRVVYAVALYAVFAVWFADTYRTLHQFSRGNLDPEAALLGYGRKIFEILIRLQFVGILLFQPALMCDRITQEKERDSLVLLFLTDLRPWEIVWQKYLGGLVPMFTCLLLGLPLAGVAYAFGGLESQSVADQWLGLLVTSLQIGALALMCSAWCRTTVGALLSSYFLGAILYVGPALLPKLIVAFLPFSSATSDFLQAWDRGNYADLIIPIAAIDDADTGSSPFSAMIGSGATRLVTLLPSIVSIVLFLLLARCFLLRRASVPPGNLLPRLFALLDRLMRWANRFAGGVVLLRERGSLPGDEPVYWRETQRRALGKPHYLLRLLCVIEIPTVFLCVGTAMIDPEHTTGLSFLAAALTVLIVFLLGTTAANSLVSERVGQTLEVLLTTPLSAGQIIRQKERALRRLEWILAVPLLTVFASEAYLRAGNWYLGANSFSEINGQRTHPSGWFPYMTCAVLMVAIYLPMITWLSLWIGLRVRTRSQAILTTLGVLAAWLAVCPLVIFLLNDRGHTDIWDLFYLASPVSAGVLNELNILRDLWDTKTAWPVIVVNTVLYGLIALIIRDRLFAQADRCLRR